MPTEKLEYVKDSNGKPVAKQDSAGNLYALNEYEKRVAEHPVFASIYGWTKRA